AVAGAGGRRISTRRARGGEAGAPGGGTEPDAARGGDDVLLRRAIGGAGGERAGHAGEHGEDAPAARARGAARGVDGRVGGGAGGGGGSEVVNCLEFERLLDEGEPERLPAEALDHAHDCASCARSLARARSLERALAAHFSPARADEAPAGFTQRVMARVERGEARGVRWLALPDVMPLWTRAAAEPGVALASAVAALL